METENENKKFINMDLPERLHMDFKLACVEEKIGMEQKIRELMQTWVNQRRKVITE